MKIVAIEEHTVSKEIDAATADAIKGAYPWYASFLKPTAADTPSIPDLFELGERRVSELDKAGIDMEILSYPNATQWLEGKDAPELARQANDRLPRQSGHILQDLALLPRFHWLILMPLPESWKDA